MMSTDAAKVESVWMSLAIDQSESAPTIFTDE